MSGVDVIPVGTLKKPRQDTRLESEGAEFLVLGQLLIHRIPSYKTYTNMQGYDLVATNPEKNLSVKIQVKSRWKTGAEGFPIQNFNCDFVVAALLNRGSTTNKNKKILDPEYFVLPVDLVRKFQNNDSSWGKVLFKNIPYLNDYNQAWHLISEFLEF